MPNNINTHITTARADLARATAALADLENLGREVELLIREADQRAAKRGPMFLDPTTGTVESVRSLAGAL